MKNLTIEFRTLILLVLFIGSICVAFAFKPAPVPVPPNYCKKISAVNLTTDAYLLSVEGELYIVIVGDKSTSIIKK